MKRVAIYLLVALATLGTLTLGSLTLAHADDQEDAPEKPAGSSGNSAAQANNPLADLTAFNIQNYYIGNLTGLPEGRDESANSLVFRYANPISFTGEDDWLLRASLPVNSFPDENFETETGLGDTNLNLFHLFDTGNPAVSFGFGPNLNAPSATDEVLGSEKWAAGFATVYFNAASPKFQYGGLITWAQEFAGSDNREDYNLGAVQPFAFYQLGNGLYLRAAPIWQYNFENDNYGFPMGLGIGKVFQEPTESGGKNVYNFFIEPQYSVADDGVQPEWQIFAALNMQFY